MGLQDGTKRDRLKRFKKEKLLKKYTGMKNKKQDKGVVTFMGFG